MRIEDNDGPPLLLARTRPRKRTAKTTAVVLGCCRLGYIIVLSPFSPRLLPMVPSLQLQIICQIAHHQDEASTYGIVSVSGGHR